MQIGINIESKATRDDMSKAEQRLKDLFEQEIENTLQATLKDAKKYAPVRSGKLRDETVYQKTENGGQIVNLTSYGPYVELGTIYMSAQPFLKPAYRKNVAKLFKNLKAKV